MPDVAKSKGNYVLEERARKEAELREDLICWLGEQGTKLLLGDLALSKHPMPCKDLFDGRHRPYMRDDSLHGLQLTWTESKSVSLLALAVDGWNDPVIK